MNISISVRLASLNMGIPNVSCQNFEEIIKKVQPTNALIKIIGKERVFRVFPFYSPLYDNDRIFTRTLDRLLS